MALAQICDLIDVIFEPSKHKLDLAIIQNKLILVEKILQLTSLTVNAANVKHCILNDQVEMFYLLSAKLNQKQNYVEIAAGHGSIKIFTDLFNRGISAEEQEDAFFAAVDNNHLSIIKFLLDHGQDVHEMYDFAIRNTSSIPIVELLLEHGADINAIPPERLEEYTALHNAIKNKNNELVVFLLDHGADINLISFPHNAINIACLYNKDIIKLLIERGADLNCKCYETPLTILATLDHNVSLIKLLLDHGANIDLINLNGQNTLHVAAYWGNIAVVKLLIERGAKLNVKDWSGDTALEIARSRGHLSIVRLLSRS